MSSPPPGPQGPTGPQESSRGALDFIVIGGVVALVAGVALGILPGSAGNTDCGSVFNPAYNMQPSFGDWMFGNPARDACVELHNGLRTPMLVLLIVGGAATLVGGIVKAYRNHSS